MNSALHFYDKSALLERLTHGIKGRNTEVVFLVGAPFSAPRKPGEAGVPGADGVIDLIRAEFQTDPAQLNALEEDILRAGDKRYQAAFTFLQGRRGQRGVNETVRRAVLLARGSSGALDTEQASQITEDYCRFLEADVLGWALNPGTEYLGKLSTDYPAHFGKLILTTNFDPLIEVAIRRVGGTFLKTIFHADGYLGQTEGTGCHVVHLHGYWYGSDTLHTPRQLGQARPRLKASLSSLLRDKIVVVAAYSGWDDAFTDALMDVVRDDTAFPEIIWTFHSSNPNISNALSDRLSPGIDRGRITLYQGIDCHDFLPDLHQAWTLIQKAVSPPGPRPSNPVQVSRELLDQIENRHQHLLEGEEEDRPPYVEICVGREKELETLRNSKAKVFFLTGIGGQGKSTLAARYFSERQNANFFSIYVWRDCKEEGERFENQLASVVEKLSNGKVSAKDLAQESVSSIVEVLLRLIRNVRVLFVFDNADHYVDLETRLMTGSADAFIESLLESGSPSQAVFTCRPSIAYDHPLAFSKHLESLSLDATLQLFSQRNAPSVRADIEDAYKVTEGHAFWLDLLAIQVAKPLSPTDLHSLVNEIRSGRGPLPEKTLNSIWGTLRPREEVVLRGLAETVKPETEETLGDYLRHEMNYGKLVKALNALKALNLVVVKRRPNTPDVLELHPLVREFVHRRFTRAERLSFIDAILKVYKRLIGKHKAELAGRPSLSVLLNWTQNAELDIAAGRLNEAFDILGEVGSPFSASAYPREFCRVARLLLSLTDWTRDFYKYRGFETVFSAQIRNLSYLGEYDEVEFLLDQYEKTVVSKDTRYINFCEMKSFSMWVRGDFLSAVEWGKTGHALKQQSGVDTIYDVAHALALAERDAGRPEVALPMFLEGKTVADVTSATRVDEDESGAYYGNIGRCLHFLGQVDEALICYQKSALLLEKKTESEHVLNQGFIRAWIGELLVAKEEFQLAAMFLRAAYLKWENVSPPKAANVISMLDQVRLRFKDPKPVNDSTVEKIFLDWIKGRQFGMTGKASG
ncbi:MAG TPA: SIR2 family protein [Candidatus Angelobacter sp.]|nr:SIR2 family protein [Candidatus Angelobacter sp.]